MPSISIEWWPIDKPQPYSRNARIIPQNAIDVVARSLEQNKWRQPIVVDDKGEVVAGHTRLLAAKQLGMKTVPIHVATGLTEDQIKAYRLMDNRSNQESMWDHLVLKDELSRLGTSDTFDVSMTGFTDDEFAAFAQQVDIGRFTEPPKEFKTFGAELETDCLCPHCGYTWKGGVASTGEEESAGAKTKRKYAHNSGAADSGVRGDDAE